MVYATEKSLKDLGDKVDAETKSNVEKEIEKLKKLLEDQNSDVDVLKKGIEDLTQASHKLAEIMYSQATKDQAGPDAGAGAEDAGGKKDDDVVDADFEEVK